MPRIAPEVNERNGDFTSTERGNHLAGQDNGTATTNLEVYADPLALTSPEN